MLLNFSFYEIKGDLLFSLNGDFYKLFFFFFINADGITKRLY